jgi:hypothetical protein
MQELRGKNQAADRIARIVAAIQVAGQTAHVVDERIAVEIVIAVRPITAAVKFADSALGDQ